VLSRWRREHLASADALRGVDDLRPGELAAELRKARQEVEDLREQRDILKKALSIFSHRWPKGARS
jgi:transposase-like protein